ncbi:hypothetical protein BV898_04100 [Hypsibius exemplaris]|uniref:Uncharacterized protein n=1 Tax=Hypsibius exemplaris TaxID=2072580 RepID=A0A1W0X2W6_HYPEX|nr:hypothetical protein BV898_04100 [Hypsibius exemplaris]
MPGLRIIDIQYSTIKPPEPSETIFGDLDNLGWIALHGGLRSITRRLSGGINWDKCAERERKYILELYTYPQFEGVRQLLKEKSNLTAGYGLGELYNFGHSANIKLEADEMFTPEEIESLKLYLAQAAPVDRNSVSEAQLVQGSGGDNLGGARRRTNFGLIKSLRRRLRKML